MRLFFLSCCFLLVASGCRSTALSDSVRDQIPEGAAAVVLLSDMEANEFYASAREELRDMGFRLADTPGDRLVLVTEEMAVGGTMTQLRLVAVVEKRFARKPRLILSGEYDLAPYGYTRAANIAGPRNRAILAFEELLVIARKMPHTEIRFWSEGKLDRSGYGNRDTFL